MEAWTVWDEDWEEGAEEVPEVPETWDVDGEVVDDCITVLLVRPVAGVSAVIEHLSIPRVRFWSRSASRATAEGSPL